jgi:hypothetical protein
VTAETFSAPHPDWLAGWDDYCSIRGDCERGRLKWLAAALEQYCARANVRGMGTRLTKGQRKLLDELYELVADPRFRPSPRLITKAFARLDATLIDEVSRNISDRFKVLLRDMPPSGEVREDLLALLNSWGDTLDDETVVAMLEHSGRVFSVVFARVSETTEPPK